MQARAQAHTHALTDTGTHSHLVCAPKLVTVTLTEIKVVLKEEAT